MNLHYQGEPDGIWRRALLETQMLLPLLRPKYLFRPLVLLSFLLLFLRFLSRLCLRQLLSMFTHLKLTPRSRYELCDDSTINFTTNGGYTVLMNACLYHSPDDVWCLLQRGLNVNAADKDGFTALMFAVERRAGTSSAILQCLLEHGADANVTEKDGRTALMILISQDEKPTMNVTDHHRMIYLLLKHGADVNRWNKGNTPLMDVLWRYQRMTRRDPIDFLPPLLRSRQPKRQNSPMKSSDYRFMVERLLQAGANVNAVSNYHGHTSLLITIARHEGKEHDVEGTIEHSRIVKLLLNNGADVNAVHPVNGKTPLMFAASYEHSPGIFQMILDSPGVDINAQDQSGRSALFYAASDNNVEAVSSLLNLGANANIAESLLEQTITCEFSQVAVMLVQAGADVIRGPTPPLIMAVATRQLDVIAAILKVDGVDVNGKDEGNEFCALDFCVNSQKFCAKSAALLLQHGANANGVRIDRGTTPLIDVIEFDYPEMVDVFLQHNVDVNVPTGELNQTAIQAAVRHGKAHYVRQLLQYGADWRPCLAGAMVIPKRHKAAVEAEFCKFFRQQGAHYCAVRDAVRRCPIPSGSEFFAEIGVFVPLMSEEDYESMKQQFRRMGGKALCRP